jgi:hypothetical protein
MRNDLGARQKLLMLRSAQRARLEARTTAMQLLLAAALLLVANAAVRARTPTSSCSR